MKRTILPHLNHDNRAPSSGMFCRGSKPLAEVHADRDCIFCSERNESQRGFFVEDFCSYLQGKFHCVCGVFLGGLSWIEGIDGVFIRSLDRSIGSRLKTYFSVTWHFAIVVCVFWFTFTCSTCSLDLGGGGIRGSGWRSRWSYLVS